MNKSECMESLRRVADECSEANWDGYNALPVSKAAIGKARQFIETMPDDMPDPEFCAEPGGGVSVDWCVSPGRIVGVSIGESDQVAFAWLIDGSSGHGVTDFDGKTFPRKVDELVRQVTA